MDINKIRLSNTASTTILQANTNNNMLMINRSEERESLGVQDLGNAHLELSSFCRSTEVCLITVVFD